MKSIIKILILLTLLFPLKTQSNDSLIIVFSKIIGSENYSKYCTYLKSINPKAKCINAYGLSLNEVEEIIKKADGLVLTGGPDVNPSFYGKAQDSNLCEVDNYRDSLEFKLLDFAFKMEIPIFAICRGHQLLNVYLGGTLYPDIPTYFPSGISHRCDTIPNKCFHMVYVNRESDFFKMVELDSFQVNSFHHQGVEKLAKGLQPTAHSPDGLIEAFEWEKPNSKPFFIAVQWHPERLALENPISKILGQNFIKKVIERKSFKLKRNKINQFVPE